MAGLASMILVSGSVILRHGLTTTLYLVTSCNCSAPSCRVPSIDRTVGERAYTELKCLGDGSFGTVWLCDWHSPVKHHVLLSAMQCGAGARPEWSGKRLVALKRMKRVWEGGWSQAKTLGELVVSRNRLD